MNTNITIPIVNIILALLAVGFGIRMYVLIRHGLLGPTWILFILGAFFFGVMQLAATLIRSNNVDIGINLRVVHDVAALLLIVSFLAGFYLQVRAFTQELTLPTD